MAQQMHQTGQDPVVSRAVFHGGLSSCAQDKVVVEGRGSAQSLEVVRNAKKIGVAPGLEQFIFRAGTKEQRATRSA